MEKTKSSSQIKECVALGTSSVKEYVYVLYRYDPHYGDDCEIVDVFRSVDTAKTALLELIKKDFMIVGGEAASEYDTTESNSEDNDGIKTILDSKPLVPGFDKKNWNHMQPIILEEIDRCKEGWWLYENKYGYQTFKCEKKVIK